MGIDSMRVGGGRCSPLIVGGLILACFILVCNWWTLSSENLELLRQLDDLSEQLKLSAEDRDKCITLQENLEQSYKSTQVKLANANVQLEQQNGLQSQKALLEEQIAVCQDGLLSWSKLDARKNETLDTLRFEKDTLNVTLHKMKEENEEQKKKLNRVTEELSKLKLTLNSPDEKKPHDTPVMPPPAESKLDNETLNGVNQEIQDKADSQRANDHIDEVNNAEETENVDEGLHVGDSERDQLMKTASDPDKKEDINI